MKADLDGEMWWFRRSLSFLAWALFALPVSEQVGGLYLAEAVGADGCSGWMELEYRKLRQEEGRLYGRSHPDKNIPQIFSHPLPTRPKKWLYGEGGFAGFISCY